MQKQNTTDFAIAEHLAALPHGRYEVGIFDAALDKMSLRRWDHEGVKKAIPYLKAQNSRGLHIYLRPEGSHPYSLVDDLSPAKLADMKAGGFLPALVVETSPGNLQAWIHHGEVLEPRLSTAVAKAIAQRFGGDPSSADWRHFGRLAGFTNRKNKYQRDDGRYPFVRVIEATGQRCVQSEELIRAVTRELENQRVADASRRAQYRDTPQSPGLRKTISDFRSSPIYGQDHHRADLAYATYALSHGGTRADIERAIRSRDLSHKGGEARQTDYVERTIAKAQDSVRGRSVGR